MIIGFIGDSITHGVGASLPENSFVNRVKETLQCNVINCGISGSRLARQREISFPHQMDMDFSQKQG